MEQSLPIPDLVTQSKRPTPIDKLDEAILDLNDLYISLLNDPDLPSVIPSLLLL